MVSILKPLAWRFLILKVGIPNVIESLIVLRLSAQSPYPLWNVGYLSMSSEFHTGLSCMTNSAADEVCDLV